MNDRNLDKALDAWGQWQPGDDAAIARLIGHADALPSASLAAPSAPVSRRRWWLAGAGGAIAASLALGLLLLPPAAPDPLAADPSASFAMLYTPTMEEEYLL